MSKIIIIVAVFPPEPVVSSKLAYDIATDLSIANQVIVLSPKPTRPYGFDFSQNPILQNQFSKIEIKSYTCPQSSFMGRIWESYSFGRKTSRYIHENYLDIDAIYADTWPLFGQLFIVSAAKKHDLPIVIHVQDIYPESLANKFKPFSSILKYLLLPLDRFILKNATSVIAISESMKNYLSLTRKISKDKISVVLNWQDENPFLIHKAVDKTNEKFTFMYLGNIGPVAGVELLIDAFVYANIPNSRLVIAGAGSMKDKLVKKASAHLTSDIQFWKVPEGKVPEIQSKANVMLLPIRKGAASSSIPSKLPAYMFSAKPVICCAEDSSDTAKCIRDAECGYVVEPEQVIQLSQVMINSAHQDLEILKEMGERGFNYAISVFSKKQNLFRLAEAINNSLI